MQGLSRPQPHVHTSLRVAGPDAATMGDTAKEFAEGRTPPPPIPDKPPRQGVDQPTVNDPAFMQLGIEQPLRCKCVRDMCSRDLVKNGPQAYGPIQYIWPALCMLVERARHAFTADRSCKWLHGAQDTYEKTTFALLRDKRTSGRSKGVLRSLLSITAPDTSAAHSAGLLLSCQCPWCGGPGEKTGSPLVRMAGACG